MYQKCKEQSTQTKVRLMNTVIERDVEEVFKLSYRTEVEKPELDSEEQLQLLLEKANPEEKSRTKTAIRGQATKGGGQIFINKSSAKMTKK